MGRSRGHSRGGREERLDLGRVLDPRLGLDAAAITAAMGDPVTFIGTAGDQVGDFVSRVDALASRYPDAAAYTGEEIL